MKSSESDAEVEFPGGGCCREFRLLVSRWLPLVCPTMASSGSVVDGVGENDGTAGVTGGATRNPFICGVCHDYYNEPCLLSCFHTFCARCIRGPHLDGKVSCPICG